MDGRGCPRASRYLGYWFYATASDHDDGENDMKARSLNLTDLYVFREKDLNSRITDDNLVFVMNTNPCSVAWQQYYWFVQRAFLPV